MGLHGALAEVGKANRLTIDCVPGHKIIYSNEEEDRVAKEVGHYHQGYQHFCGFPAEPSVIKKGKVAAMVAIVTGTTTGKNIL